jgi:hypothetical protein
MDRYGRNGGGGGGTPYIMPMFEDGSAYGPGDPVYNRVTSLMPPEQWNGLSDGQKWTMLVNAQGDVDNAMNFQSRTAQGVPHPPAPEVSAFLSQLAQGQTAGRLQGLFGAGPGPSTVMPSTTGPAGPALAPTPMPAPTPQATPTGGVSSFAAALRRLMEG